MKNQRLLITLWIIFLFFLTACDSFQYAVADGDLVASGIVEVVEVDAASELGGLVIEVFAVQGQMVRVGDSLFQLDDRLLTAQRLQAVAALETAQGNLHMAEANLDTARAAAELAKSAAALEKAAAATDLLADQQALNLVYETWPDQATLAQQALKDARQRQHDAERRLGYLTTIADQADIDLAYTQMVLAEDALEDARDDFEPFENKPVDNLVRAVRQQKMAEAQLSYDAAVRRYNALVDTANEFDISQGEAELAIANAQLAQAEQDYLELIDGPDPDDIVLAEARIAAAQTRLDSAEDAVLLALVQVDQAAAAVGLAENVIAEAQAQIDALDVQISKLLVQARATGVVLVRNIQPGEVLAPGTAALTIGMLDDLTVTVYVPENRYGQVSLGDSVRVTADSFPGTAFEGQVIKIADQAEFTPRNVQTQEERVKTVYAVEIKVVDLENQLKPGMPVQVIFPVDS